MNKLPLYSFIVIFFVFTACEIVSSTTPEHTNPIDIENENTSSTFKVSFNSNGGSFISDISNILPGETIVEPDYPTWAYGSFLGWYKDDTFINEWIFTQDVVTTDIVLYAKWNELEVGDIGPSGGIIFYDDTIGLDWDINGGIIPSERNLFIGKGLEGKRFLEATDDLWSNLFTVSAEAQFNWSNDSIDMVGIPNILPTIENYKLTVGEGEKYTNIIHSYHMGVQTDSAGERCYWATCGGFNDWFLPSAGELKLLMLNRVWVQNMSDSDNYWSSSEYSDSQVIYNDGLSYGISYSLKTNAAVYVRPIRAF